MIKTVILLLLLQASRLDLTAKEIENRTDFMTKRENIKALMLKVYLEDSTKKENQMP